MLPDPTKTFELLTPGEKFADYQILKCVTYDLFGSLYLVRKTKEKEECCLFLLPPMVKHNEQFLANFDTATQQLIQCIQHKNALSYSTPQVIKERYAIYCETFQAENLEDYAISHAPPAISSAADNASAPANNTSCGLPQDEVRTILMQVVQALQFAHKQQIFHLNLHPAHILRNAQGHIKLAGLGMIQMLGKDLFDRLVSVGVPPIAPKSEHVRINTVDIVSPEVRQGHTPDQRADFYALGVTAYWLLTGTKPARNYQPPSEIVNDLYPGWDVIIQFCLEPEPQKRYQTTAHLLKDLKSLEKLTARSKPAAAEKETRSGLKLLEYIPAPKRLKEKGLFHARTFRLGIVGCLLLMLAIMITAVFNNGQANSTDNPAAAIVLATDEIKPTLIFNITPANSRVHFIQENVTFPSQQGQLQLNIPPGDYRLEITAPHYKPLRQPLQIAQASQADEAPQTLDLQLEKAWGDLVIHTLPAATATAIDADGTHIPLGQAGESGILKVTNKLLQGNYTIAVEKPNHARSLRKITLASTRVTESFSLAGNPGALRVRSNPSGATVKIDDQVFGTTNLTIEDLPVGERFIVSVEMAGYRPISKAVTLQPGTRTPLDFGNLELKSGSLRPSLTINRQPIPAQFAQTITLDINGQEWPGTTDVIKDLIIGTYALTVQHPDYHPIHTEVRIKDKAEVKLDFDLTPKPAILAINPMPPNIQTQLTINGRPQKPNPNNRYALKPGKYQLKLNAPNHHTVSKQFQFKPNETVAWDAVLKPLAGPQFSQNYVIPYAQLELAWINPSAFTMGSPSQLHGRLPTDGPQTEVTLTQGYWIGTFEVTQHQFKHIIKKTPASFARSPQHPVESVTWHQAMRFCEVLTQRESRAGRVPAGYEYRLPTEAEWEYAARAGSTAPFHWGHTADYSNANIAGVYPRDYVSKEIRNSDHYGSMPVGSFKPNAFGLYDVHGNVSEWCIDYYNARLPGGYKTDWIQTQENTKRPHRGGGWKDFAVAARAGSRGKGARPTTSSEGIGFRIVLGPVKQR